MSPRPTARLTRRGLLTGAAAVAGLEVTRRAVAGAAPAPNAGPAPQAGAPAPATSWGHAAEPRGLDIAVTVGREKQGRFGLMFPKLPAYASHSLSAAILVAL